MTRKSITISVSELTYRAWQKSHRCPMQPMIDDIYEKDGKFYLTGSFKTIDEAEKAAYFLKCSEDLYCFDFDFSTLPQTDKRNRLIIPPSHDCEALEAWYSNHPYSEITLTKLRNCTEPAYYIDNSKVPHELIAMDKTSIKTNMRFVNAWVIEGPFSLNDLQYISDEINCMNYGEIMNLIYTQCGYIYEGFLQRNTFPV